MSFLFLEKVGFEQINVNAFDYSSRFCAVPGSGIVLCVANDTSSDKETCNNLEVYAFDADHGGYMEVLSSDVTPGGSNAINHMYLSSNGECLVFQRCPWEGTYAGSNDPWELGVWAWRHLMENSETAVADVQAIAARLIGQADENTRKVGLALLEDIPSTADLDRGLLGMLEKAESDIQARILDHFRNQSQVEAPELADALSRFLEHEENTDHRVLAVDILSHLPGELTQPLWAKLYRAEPYDRVRIALLGHWRQSDNIPQENAFDELLNDPTLSFHARLTLLREGGDDLFPRLELENFVARQIEKAATIKRLCDEVEAYPEKPELLVLVLTERLKQTLTLALEALRFIDNEQAVQVAQAALRVPVVNYRALAIEIIRTLRHRHAGRALAKLLVSLF